MSARIGKNGMANAVDCIRLARVPFVLAFVGLIVASSAAAQTPQAPAAPAVSTNAALPPRLIGIAHAAIRVADLDKSRAFFAKLGYAQPFTITGKNGEVTEAFIKINDRQYIELYPSDSTHAPGFLHVCFEAQNLPGLYPTYTAKGIVAPPVKKAAAGNLLMAWKGPEAQTEEITEYQPGSRHSNDFGKDLGPDRISTHLLGAVVPMQDPQATAHYFEQEMGFTNRGTHEGAVVTTPPGLSDTYFAFRPATASEKVVLVFQVTSPRKTLTRLQELHVDADLQGGRVVAHDPDGNLLVFTQQGL